MKRLSVLILCLVMTPFAFAAPAGPKDRHVLLDVQPVPATVRVPLMGCTPSGAGASSSRVANPAMTRC